jgi:putative cell wall-binding protein/Tol biopolymer transport system component
MERDGVGRATRTTARLALSAVLVVALVLGTGATSVFAGWESTLPILRVSVASDGTQGMRGARSPDISSDGSYVVFQTGSELDALDTNGYRDVYVYDTATAETMLVSVNEDGDAAGNGNSAGSDDYDQDQAISGNGQYVAFSSWATDLVPSDTNGKRDVFVRDLQSQVTTLVSIESDGDQGGNGARSPSLTDDGGVVVFQTRSALVAGDTNGDRDIYWHDMQTGETKLVSWDKDGNAANGNSEWPQISGDGRYVAFHSWASDLVENDTNGDRDIFVRDLQTDTTMRVSVASDGTEADDYSQRPSISMDGRYVAFDSRAENLTPGVQLGGDRNVFVHDMQTSETMLVSTPRSGGMEANRGSKAPDLSADGRFVAFMSGLDLVADDTNDVTDVYVYDMMNGSYQLASRDEDGAIVDSRNGTHDHPAITGDGTWVAFDSYDSNLVSGDSNGKRDVFLRQLTPILPEGSVRWAGATRYDTAIAVSEGTFPRGADTVVIATGDNWPDALCGSALAGVVDGPILLTPTAALPQSVKDEIDRLGAENAYILGGTGVVSAAVETELEGMLDGFVNRLAGMNRYTTSKAIADTIVQLKGGTMWSGPVIVTTGENFADALAGAPLAAGLDWPVLLANPVTGDVYMPKGMDRAVILGGTGAVPMSVEMALKNSPLSNQDVVRLGGATRYETAAMTADYGVDNGLLWNGVGIATGENFPDGLTGGASAGLNRTVILLTPTASLAPAASTMLTDNKDDIMTVQFFGGPGAVSTTVENQVKSILGM